ncbi:MAG: NAD-dependent epimerase/dehydratase family protein [Chthoniobacterales bacterium]|nr:NAD-dependent epimerase/dehydratase family protein [Chthoniobacterales bacterium]
MVTGGAGFIGSHVAERLLAEGWQVVVLDDLSNGFERNLPPGADFVRGAAGDEVLLDAHLPGCAAVFHLAAVASVIDSVERPLEVHDTNLTTTLALLEASVRHKIPRFVFSSSAAVYGDAGTGAIGEDTPTNPFSHYAVQKLACEYYCGVYHRLHGLETVCLRYFNVFGPRQRADSPYTGVITKFLTAARAGRAVTIYGDGSQTRDFVHVADVAAAIFAAAVKEAGAVAGRSFNIGSGQSVSVRELAAMTAAVFPAVAAPVHRPLRTGEIMHSRAEISLARRSLEFDPRGRLEDFLAAPV